MLVSSPTLYIMHSKRVFTRGTLTNYKAMRRRKAEEGSIPEIKNAPLAQVVRHLYSLSIAIPNGTM